MAMIRVLLWMLLAMLWINVLMTASAYGSSKMQLVLSSALVLTSVMCGTSKRMREWLK